MSESLTAESFRSCIGDEFRPLIDGAKAMHLRDVNDLHGDSSRPDKNPFSLVFSAADATVEDAMPQGTYPLENEKLGTLEIFLVCLGPDLKDPQKPLLYEAVFT